MRLFVPNVVYSDSAQQELSFGTKAVSLGPCVHINIDNMTDFRHFWGYLLVVFARSIPQIVVKSGCLRLYMMGFMQAFI